MQTGDYARTKNGIIGKLNIINDTIAVANWQGDYELQDITMYRVNDNKVYKSEIKKSSPNITDLLEVGDYVNGCKVAYVSQGGAGTSGRFVSTDNDYTIFEEDIKSIVTREQFESMEYKVGK